MTEVDRIFLNSMVGYMTAIRNNPNAPIMLNTRLPAIEKLGARLSGNLQPQNFTMAKLYKARKAWGNNRNRSNYEARWLENFSQRLARAGGTNNKFRTAINGLRGGRMPSVSQNTGGQSRAMGTGQGQVVAAVQSRLNTSLENATAIVNAVETNVSTNFEKLYSNFLKTHIGKGGRMNQVLNQRAVQYPEIAEYYGALKKRKSAVNRRPRV